MNVTVAPSVNQTTDITEIIEYWSYTVGLPLVSLPGLFVSLVSVFIFTRKSMRSSLNVYLAGLSAFDFLVLSMALLIYPSMVQCVSNGHQGPWCVWFFNVAIVAFPISLIAQFGSVWTCVLLTVDRFLAVKYPLHSRGWCTTGRAFLALCVLAVSAVAYCVPTMFELTHNQDGQLIPTPLRNNELYKQIYHLWCYFVFLFLIPWTIMLILNTVVAVAVHTAYKNRKILTSKIQTQRQTKEDRERRCTVIAIAIILTFLIFNSTAFVNHALEVFVGEGKRGTSYYILRRLLIFTGNLFVCVNSATNFLIYCLGARFRQHFTRLLCPCVVQALDEYQTLLMLRRSSAIPRGSHTTGTENSCNTRKSTAARRGSFSDGVPRKKNSYATAKRGSAQASYYGGTRRSISQDGLWIISRKYRTTSKDASGPTPSGMQQTVREMAF